MAKKWIQAAIKHPGALTAAAKRAGLSTMGFARKHAKSPGTLGKRARLALTLRKLPRPSKAARARGGRRAAATRARRKR